MQQFTKKMLIPTLVSGLLFTASPASLGETTAANIGKRIPSKAEIIDLLSPSPADTQASLDSELPTRGLHLWPNEPEPEKKAVSLEVRFAFDSAELTEEAKAQLTPVAQALTSNELTSINFTLEGHTDASGSEQYNLALSERRAASVKNYFIDEFGVEADRLKSIGKGESSLLDTENPNADTNRRVTIITQ